MKRLLPGTRAHHNTDNRLYELERGWTEAVMLLTFAAGCPNIAEGCGAGS
jgi:hypothetical protein